MLVILAVYGFVFGAVFASFGCVVSERVPRGLSVNGRSQCACGRQLRAVENVPVLGWLRARKGTSCCGVKLPARYVVAEVALGVVGAVLAGMGWSLFSMGVAGLAVIVGGVLAFGGAFAGLLALTWQRSANPR